MAAVLAGRLEVEIAVALARITNDMKAAVAIVTSASNSMQAAAELAGKALGAIGVGASVSGIALFIKSGIDAEAQLHKLWLQTGITVEMLSALKGIAKQAGTDLESVASMVAKLERNMLTFAQSGGGKAAAAFAQLGYSQAQVKAGLQDMDKFLPEFAKRLIETGVGGEQAGLAMQLMAKGGAQALPFLHQLAENGPLVAKVTTEQAEAAHQFEVQLVKLKAGSGGLAISLANELLPQLTATAKAMLDAKKNGEGFFGMMVAGIKTAITGDDLNKARRELVDLTDQKLILENQVSMARSRITNPENQPELVRNLNAYIAELKKVDTQLATTRGYYKLLEDETVKPIAPPKIPLGSAVDGKALINAQIELARAQMTAGLATLKDFYNNFAQLDDAYHKAGLISDATYFASKRAALEQVTIAELAVIKKTIAMEEQAKAKTGDPIEKIKIETKLVQDRAAAEKLKADFVAKSNQITMEATAAEKARNAEIAAMAVAMAELNRTQEASRAIVLDSTLADRDEAEQMRFDISLIGQTTAAQAQLTAARQIDLELRRAIAALPKDDEGNFLAGGAEAFDKLQESARQFKEVMLGITADKTLRTYLQDLANDAGNVFRQLGDDIEKSMTKAFGTAGTAMGGMVQAFAKARASQLDIDNKFYEDVQKNPANLAALDAKYQNDTLQNTLGMYGDMAGAAASYFDKQSGAYKVLHAIEVAMHVAKLAMMIEGLLMDGTVTGASVINSGIRATADGIAAFAKTLASLPFPYNLAAGAVVLGALAAVGVAISGGGGSGASTAGTAAEVQKTQGTGTVLGDASAKSASIENALKAIEAIDTLGLTYTKDMADSLRAIQNSIGNLAVAVFRAAGITNPDTSGTETGKQRNWSGPQNLIPGLDLIPSHSKLQDWIFGTVKNEIIDMGIRIAGTLHDITTNAMGALVQYATVQTTTTGFLGGLFGGNSTSTSQISNPLSDNAAKQIGLIFTSIIDSVESAVKALGLWTPQLRDLLMSLPLDMKLSLEGLKGQELTDAITAFFSGIADQIALAGVGDFDVASFQRAGEGVFETLLRVATEFEVVTHTFETLGMSTHLVGMAAFMAADDVVKLMGGLEEFQKLTADYFSKYFTPAEQHAALGANLGTAFTNAGVAMPTDLAGFRALVDGIKWTDEGAAELFATLMKLAPAFYEFSTQVVGLDGKLHTTGDALAQHISLQEKLDIQTGARTARDVDNEHRRAEAIDATSLAIINETIYQEDCAIALAASTAFMRDFTQVIDHLNGTTAHTTQWLANAANAGMSAVTTAMPWITSIGQLMSITEDDFNRYSDANKQLILTALHGADAFNTANAALANFVNTGLTVRPLMGASMGSGLAGNADINALLAKRNADLLTWEERLAIARGDTTQKEIDHQHLIAQAVKDYGVEGSKAVTILMEQTWAQEAANEATAKAASNVLDFGAAMDKLHGNTAYSDQFKQWDAANSFQSVHEAMPWIKDFNQLATMGLEDFKHYSAANQELILKALKAGGALNDLAVSAVAVNQSMLGTQQQGTRFNEATGKWELIDYAQITNQAADAAKLLNDQLALQARIFELTGDAAGAAAILEQQHAIALAALDPSLRAFQTTLWGLEKAAAAAAKTESARKTTLGLMIELEDAKGNHEYAELMRRTQILKDMTAFDAAIQQQIWDALDANKLKEATRQWTKTLEDWLNRSLLNESVSPLTGAQRLSEAQRQYEKDLMLAAQGDEDARARLTGDADNLLREALSMYGRSSAEYMAIFRSVQEEIRSLVDGNITGGESHQSVPDVLRSNAAVASKEAADLIARVSQLAEETMGLRREQRDGIDGEKLSNERIERAVTAGADHLYDALVHPPANAGGRLA